MLMNEEPEDGIYLKLCFGIFTYNYQVKDICF
jgi:hypothetical protein